MGDSGKPPRRKCSSSQVIGDKKGFAKVRGLGFQAQGLTWASAARGVLGARSLGDCKCPLAGRRLCQGVLREVRPLKKAGVGVSYATLLWLTFVLKMRSGPWWVLIWEGKDQSCALIRPLGRRPGDRLSLKGGSVRWCWSYGDVVGRGREVRPRLRSGGGHPSLPLTCRHSAARRGLRLFQARNQAFHTGGLSCCPLLSPVCESHLICCLYPHQLRR